MFYLPLVLRPIITEILSNYSQLKYFFTAEITILFSFYFGNWNLPLLLNYGDLQTSTFRESRYPSSKKSQNL